MPEFLSHPHMTAEFMKDFHLKKIQIDSFGLLNVRKPSRQTNSSFAPENRVGPKGNESSSNHPFSGAFAVSFRETILFKILMIHLK